LEGNDGISLPEELPGNKHVYHLYSVRVSEREACQRFLQERGISTAVHYPIPVSEQESFQHLGYTQKDLPISSQISKEVLSLPMYPEMREEQVEYVCKCLLAF
jgi:dTDP-4-amino-4,6-dideoxygalactose transaminase